MVAGEGTADPAHCRVPRTGSRGVLRPREPRGQKWEACGKRAVIKWAVTGPFPMLSQHCSSHFQAASWKHFLACLQMPKVPEPRQKLSGWLITKCTTTNPPRAGAEPSRAVCVETAPGSTAQHSLSGVGQAQHCLSGWGISLSLSLSLSRCLWCNAVFSALAALLTGALRVLEEMRELLCKAAGCSHHSHLQRVRAQPGDGAEA